jgi:nitrous oxidase accessory protein
MIKNHIIWKCLAVGIILLFVGTCFIPAIAQDTQKSQSASRDNWLYVGGSGPGNYTSIQDAINDSSNGDTIFVYDDSSPYYENNIWINTSINLIGENKYTTIIDGKGGGNSTDVIRISANKVKVTGFTISNCSGCIEDTGIYIGHAKDHGINHYRDIKTVFNANISDNIFINTATGIMEIKTFHTIISGNLITSMGVPDGFKNTTDFGIGCGTASSTIKGNTILNPRVSGMDFSYTHCLVEGNVISNGTQPSNHRGITQMFCSNKIIGNTISNFWYGISLDFSIMNTISQNNISRCHLGIFVVESFSNSVTNNNITFCEDYGVLLEYSILTSVKENNFINNNISASFMKSIGIRWVRNYWDDWSGTGPKVIKSIDNTKVKFDWHPAQEPYNIPGMS